MNKQQLAQYFDHTILKQTATENDIRKLCQEAVENNFFAVCVNPCWISACKEFLTNSSVQLCTVIGFPLGANSTAVKIFEAQQAIETGAQEIDLVINVGALKSGNKKFVAAELKEIVDACDSALTKVIVESGELTDQELIFAIEAVNNSGADFIKTSTGFAGAGASEQAIKLMTQYRHDNLKIKASGGIKNLADSIKFIKLGVERIGASQSVNIINELKG